jgi:hypothetical protein
VQYPPAPVGAGGTHVSVRVLSERANDDQVSPVISMTSLTGESLMLRVAAMVRRCERALRAGAHGACLEQGADLP